MGYFYVLNVYLISDVLQPFVTMSEAIFLRRWYSILLIQEPVEVGIYGVRAMKPIQER